MTGRRLDGGEPIDEGTDSRFRRIWKAVLLQAILDMHYTGSNADLVNQRMVARIWASDANPDFRTVCDYAGYHPAYVHHRIMRSFANGIQVRAAPGSGERYLERKLYRMKSRSESP